MMTITITAEKPDNVQAFREWLQAQDCYPSDVERRVYYNGNLPCLVLYAVAFTPPKDAASFDRCLRELRKRFHEGKL